MGTQPQQTEVGGQETYRKVRRVQEAELVDGVGHGADRDACLARPLAQDEKCRAWVRVAVPRQKGARILYNRSQMNQCKCSERHERKHQMEKGRTHRPQEVSASTVFGRLGSTVSSRFLLTPLPPSTLLARAPVLVLLDCVKFPCLGKLSQDGMVHAALLGAIWEGLEIRVQGWVRTDDLSKQA